MKILRSITQRGFNVGTAGYFTVLRPNTWFAASRSERRLRRHIDGGAPFSGSQTIAAPSLDANLGANDPGKVRLALTGLAATAITAALLWWIMHPA